MKGKGLKNTQRKKGRPSRPESVSQRKRSPGKSGWDPRKCQSPDAQHSRNKISTVEEKNWVSRAQSCSEGSESIKKAFMDKGVVPQGTKDEKKTKKGRSSGKRTFNAAAKDSSYLGKMTRVEGRQKS